MPFILVLQGLKKELYVSLFLSAKDLNCCLVKCRKSSQAASHGKQCHILLTHKIVLQRPLQGDGTNRDAGQLPIGIFNPNGTGVFLGQSEPGGG